MKKTIQTKEPEQTKPLTVQQAFAERENLIRGAWHFLIDAHRHESAQQQVVLDDNADSADEKP